MLPLSDLFDLESSMKKKTNPPVEDNTGIEYLDASAYQPQQDLVYEDVFDLLPLYERLAFNANIVLVGPKGIGKSLSAAYFAAQQEVPVITFDCSEDVRRSHLLGMFVLRGTETPFVLGPLTTAFQIANEQGKCILLLEEINALTPQMQKVLNAPLDFRRKIEVPEAKQVFRLRDGAQLWVVGTMNTAVYGGVYDLNEDLKSRVRLFPLDYPQSKGEKRIVDAVLKGSGIRLDPTIIQGVLTLAHETRQKSLEYALSTRDVVQLLEDIHYVGKEAALWIVSGKFEAGDRGTVCERIHSIFGVKINGSAQAT